ncbi:MAG: adenylyl-sulfate kinase [Nitrospirae bacterium]|nr:adenylyl-sulfate kinase [Nitrospirota bacterium]MBI5696176.1 adenylyl-sulfate kinase [Nitrospirota bacterium]
MGSGERHLVWHNATITRKHREELGGHKSVAIWFTGLSGSGKSTLAHALEDRLYRLGCRSYVFDGDNVRHGLNRDLGFSAEDRKENIRRIGEMVKLFLDAGVITITAFISPFKADRQWVRELVGPENFVEVYCDCSLDVCEERDVKGSYKKARAGLIPEFTGISSPYEKPDAPELSFDTANSGIDECVDSIVTYLIGRGTVPASPTAGK